MLLQGMLERPRLHDTTAVSIDHTVDEISRPGRPRRETLVIATGDY
jgi:hypothetical protein